MENQLVLLKDPNTKPLDWPMGRILEVFPGSDGLVRVVNVKTSTGILKRAITKKNAAESQQMLVEAYGGNALSRAQCYRWFEKFQNGGFDVRNEERGIPAKIFENAELQALIDEDDGQKQEHLA
ncbi:mariner Mos1 transposase [Trichonephila clavipes]|nr:mariner Mos1 transposase [Trichonephila clavipes]